MKRYFNNGIHDIFQDFPNYLKGENIKQNEI